MLYVRSVPWCLVIVPVHSITLEPPPPSPLQYVLLRSCVLAAWTDPCWFEKYLSLHGRLCHWFEYGMGLRQTQGQIGEITINKDLRKETDRTKGRSQESGRSSRTASDLSPCYPLWDAPVSLYVTVFPVQYVSPPHTLEGLVTGRGGDQSG